MLQKRPMLSLQIDWMTRWGSSRAAEACEDGFGRQKTAGPAQGVAQLLVGVTGREGCDRKWQPMRWLHYAHARIGACTRRACVGTASVARCS